MGDGTAAAGRCRFTQFPLLSLPPSLPPARTVLPIDATGYFSRACLLLCLSACVASHLNCHRVESSTGLHRDATGKFYRVGRRDGSQGCHNVVSSLWRKDNDVLKTMICIDGNKENLSEPSHDYPFAQMEWTPICIDGNKESQFA